MKKNIYDFLKTFTVEVRHTGGPSTGFFASEDLILTTAHSLKNIDTVTCWLDGKEIEITDKYIVLNSDHSEDAGWYDIGIIRAKNPRRRYAKLRYRVREEDKCIAFGYAKQDYGGGSVYLVCKGFSGNSSEGPPRIKFGDAKIGPGMSGSAIFNIRTKAICGVISSTFHAKKQEGGRGVAIREFLKEIPELYYIHGLSHRIYRFVRRVLCLLLLMISITLIGIYASLGVLDEFGNTGLHDASEFCKSREDRLEWFKPRLVHNASAIEPTILSKIAHLRSDILDRFSENPLSAAQLIAQIRPDLVNAANQNGDDAARLALNCSPGVYVYLRARSRYANSLDTLFADYVRAARIDQKNGTNSATSTVLASGVLTMPEVRRRFSNNEHLTQPEFDK